MLCECTRLWLRRNTRSPSVSWEGCAREDCEAPRSLAFPACSDVTDVTDVPSMLVLTSTLLPPAVCTVVAGALGWELRGDARCRTMLSSRADMFDGVRARVKLRNFSAPGFKFQESAKFETLAFVVSSFTQRAPRRAPCVWRVLAPPAKQEVLALSAHAAVEHTATIAMSEEVHYSGYLTKSPPNIER
jgi:hypothetical protein